MQEVFGNLWEFDGTKAITTNGFVKRDGTCVMGRGCAREAAQRFPRLPRELGTKIKATGNHVYSFPEYNIVTFPVKHNWWEAADLKLITQSAFELLDLDCRAPVYLPRPGCGNGRLHWSDVRPILHVVLRDVDIRIVAFPHQGGTAYQ